MCVAEVIVMYFEAYKNHCYTDEPIKNLNNISYLSLHVYILIHLDLFSDMLQEECYLLTHHVPSNVVYHISKNAVLIDNNILKLLGDEKKYYFEYFGCKDIIKKMTEYI